MSQLENLDNLVKIRQLHKEPPDAREFAGLKQTAANKLADAQREANSLDSRFDLAYNAAHSLCLAALRRLGYRPENRYLVFQVLPHTLGVGPEVLQILARCHDVRNRADYEGAQSVDSRLQAELIKACKAVSEALDKLPPPP